MVVMKNMRKESKEGLELRNYGQLGRNYQKES